MIARFVYTECVSPGPYKREGGFKYKSVVVPSLFGGGTVAEVQAPLESAARMLMAFEPPNATALMTRQEFEGLPKSWIFAQADPQTFIFARLFTSGTQGGRPRNPFVEGFVLGRSEWTKVAAYANQASKPFFARPIDFVDSTGWITARGDAEVEAVALPEEGFFELQSGMFERISNLIDWGKEHEDTISILLTAFADSQVSGGACPIPLSYKDDFYKATALLSRLIPQQYAWLTGFSDTWANARPETSIAGMNSHLILSDTKRPQAGAIAQNWARLATAVLNSDSPIDVVSMIDELSTAFRFVPSKPEQGLSLLPLAYLLLEDFLVDDSEAPAIEIAGQVGSMIALPERWSSEALKDKWLSRFEDQGRVFRKATDSEKLYARLSAIEVVDPR